MPPRCSAEPWDPVTDNACAASYRHLRESVFAIHRRDGAPPDDYVLKSQLARQELQVDKHLLQLLSSYCKADRLEAALDATLLLSQPASLAAARKISEFFVLPALTERIDLIRQAKTGDDTDNAATKRQSKWTHTTDERTIPVAVANVDDRAYRGGASKNMFAGGADDFFSPKPSAMSSVFGSGRKSSTPSASSSKRRKSVPAPSRLAVDSGFGSDGADANESMDVDGGYASPDADERPSSPKRFRSSPSPMDDEVEEESNAAPPKKGQFTWSQKGRTESQADCCPFLLCSSAVNPFAKRAPAAKSAAPAANPFAGKKGGNLKEVKRTDSFFNRVEGTAPPKSKYCLASLAALCFGLTRCDYLQLKRKASELRTVPRPLRNPKQPSLDRNRRHSSEWHLASQTQQRRRAGNERRPKEKRRTERPRHPHPRRSWMLSSRNPKRLCESCREKGRRWRRLRWRRHRSRTRRRAR